MQSAFVRQSVELKEFKWMPEGSRAFFVVDYENAQKGQNRITAAFSTNGGKVELRVFTLVHANNPHSHKIIEAEIIKAGRAKQKPTGRPPRIPQVESQVAEESKPHAEF